MMTLEVPRLTPTEREILLLVTNGKTAEEISMILGNSVHTVRKHTEALRNKFGVYKDTHLVSTALRSGVIE
jgi:DNA-binding CsgD family transcriptional regulator